MVSHVVGSAGDKAVYVTIDQCVVGRVGGGVVANGGIHRIVQRHHQFNIVYATARWVVSGGEGEVAYHRVCGKGLGCQMRCGRQRIEGVLPNVGGNGGILVEDDGGFDRHSITRGKIVLG